MVDSYGEVGWAPASYLEPVDGIRENRDTEEAEVGEGQYVARVHVVSFMLPIQHFNIPHSNYSVSLFVSAKRPSLTGYPLTHVLISHKLPPLIVHDQLPSGIVAQLVEQRWSVPEVVGSSPRLLKQQSS